MPRERLRDGTIFSIRATPAQKQALVTEAERRGMSQSDLVRQALTDAGVPLWAGVRS
jgi:predicted HicB family RNase H-like nuclease